MGNLYSKMFKSQKCCYDAYTILRYAHNNLSSYTWNVYRYEIKSAYSDIYQYIDTINLNTYAIAHDNLNSSICHDIWDVCEDHRALLFTNLLMVANNNAFGYKDFLSQHNSYKLMYRKEDNVVCIVCGTYFKLNGVNTFICRSSWYLVPNNRNLGHLTITKHKFKLLERETTVVEC